MNKLLTTLAVTAALASTQAAAAPGVAQIAWAEYGELGFVEILTDATVPYSDLYKRVDTVDVPVSWNVWSGDAATSWKVLDGEEVIASGSGTGSSTTAKFTRGGAKSMVVELCNADGCSQSAPVSLTITDTDGSHLQPFYTQEDDANTPYEQDPNKIVGTYYVEWSLYGRKFAVEDIPANNLTHIIYGFIPLCGANTSLGDSNPSGLELLQKVCAGEPDYSMVMHDSWAALFTSGKGDPAVPQKELLKLDGSAVGWKEIGGNYGRLMAMKQAYPHIKIVPSVGGWTLSDPFFGFTDKANRDVFVASAREFLLTWKFYDGIDIDWEFPGGQGANTSLGDPVNDGPAYVALMKELRAMMDELSLTTGRTYELTSAIGMGWDKVQDVDYGEAIQYMDNIFMMTYDYYGAWGSDTGHQTGLYCGVHISEDKCNGTGEFGPNGITDKTDPTYNPAGSPEYTVANGARLLLEQGVPAHKLVVGNTMYGRGWTGVEMVDGSPIGAVGDHVEDGSNNPLLAEGEEGTAVDEAAWAWEAGIMDYRGALLFMDANDNAQYVWDDQAKASFIWDEVSATLITLDTPQSIAAKGAWLQEQCFGGIFSWEIDGDGGTTDQNILNAMNKAVGNVPGTTTWDHTTVVKTPSDCDVVVVDPTIWAATTSYSKNDEINHMGKTYVAKWNSTGKEPGTSGHWVEVVDGGWSASTSYVKGDEVEHMGTTYVAKWNSTGKEPGVAKHWEEVVVDNGTWDTTVKYAKGEEVTYMGTTYTATWAHKGKTPGQSGAWTEVPAAEAWVYGTKYSKGDVVTFKGITYSANWGSKGKKPNQSTAWSVVK